MILRSTLVVSGFAACLCANAQFRIVGVPTNHIQRVTPDFVAPVDAEGRLIGPWIAVEEQALSTPNYAVAFDSMNTNPSNQQTYSGFYGPDAGPSRFTGNYKNYRWLNDASLPTSRLGKLVRRLRVGMTWNPLGTDPFTGSLNCYTMVRFTGPVSQSDNGPALGAPLAGIVMLRLNLAAGIYEIDANLAGTGLGLPTPASNPCGYEVQVGTYSAPTNSFVPLNSTTNTVQPLLSNMVAPGEPQFPGTNPSGSNAFMWADEATPGFPGQNRPNNAYEDFTLTGGSSFPYSERFSYDYTLDNAGYLQSAFGSFVDLAGKQISGTVTFSSLADPLTTAPTTVTLEVRNGAGDTLVMAQEVPLAANGAFTIDAPMDNAAATYTLFLKKDTWLGKLSPSFTTTAANTVVNLVLVNGDVNGDNEVGPADFTILSGAFGNLLGDPGYLAAADLNRDEEVGPADFTILSASFGLEGDPTL